MDTNLRSFGSSCTRAQNCGEGGARGLERSIEAGRGLSHARREFFLQPPGASMNAFRRLLLLALTVALAAAPAAAKSASPSKAAPAAHALAVPFIADDYETALAQARERNVPIFMDAWATWCHTCRSMKSF